MSSSTTTPDTSTTNPTTRTDHHDDRPDGGNRPATDRATTAGDRLWAALHSRPGGTVEELSADAGIGRSTAGKILSRWVADGTAARIPSDGKRSASRYAVPAPSDATPPDDTGDTATAPSDPPSAPQTEPETATPATDPTADPADERGAHGVTAPTIEDAAPGADGLVDRADGVANPAGSTPDAPPEAATDPDAVASDAAPDLASTSEPDRPADPPAADANDPDDGSAGEPCAAPPVTPGRGPRLAPGALHGMVEDYLRDHPDEEFGPTKIGHELGRSTGAVSNALERLVTAGYAIRTKDRPKRYALAPTRTKGDDDTPANVESPGA